MRSQKADYLLFFLLATFWGGSFVAIKFIVREFPPVFGAMLRVGLSLALLASLFKFSGRKLSVRFETRWKMWLAGVFAQGFPFSLLFWGERSVSPGLAGIINGTVPLWTFLLGWAVGSSESFSQKKLLGLGLGFAGIAAIFHPMISFAGTREEILGTSAIMLMAISYALGSLLNRWLLSGHKVDFRANLFHQHCASFAFLTIVSFLLESWPGPGAVTASLPAMLSVLYLGLFSTALAWLIFYHLIREWGAVRASAVTYVAPIIAIFWDFVFFNNVPHTSELLGAVAILAGVVLIHN